MDLDELVFHPWSVQGPRTLLTFVGGSGSYLKDAERRRYLDFGSQLVFTNHSSMSATAASILVALASSCRRSNSGC